MSPFYEIFSDKPSTTRLPSVRNDTFVKRRFIKTNKDEYNFILVVLLICFIKSADARLAIILEMGVY